MHRKWLGFGGGFYGLIALLTLLHIEMGEIADFVRGFEGLGTLSNLLSVSTLISIFLETLQNTITAVVWPLYWLGSRGMDHAWLWLALAYGGYWSGLKMAERHLVRNGPPDEDTRSS